MTPQEIEAFAADLMDAIQAGDGERMRGFYAPDAKLWHNTDRVEQSIDDNIRVLNWFVQTLPDREYKVLRREALPDGFVQQHVLSATLPDGTKWDMDACVVVRIVDGKIVRLDEYLDGVQSAKLRAFGR